MSLNAIGFLLLLTSAFPRRWDDRFETIVNYHSVTRSEDIAAGASVTHAAVALV